MKYSVFYYTLILCFLGACGGVEQQEKLPIRPVRYAKVSQEGSALIQRFSGTSQASKETKLSFRVAGDINSIFVVVGEEVVAGQLVAQLDPTDYNVQYEQALAQLKSAETQIKQARAQLVTSKSNYQRIEKLYENNSLPLSDFDQAKSNFEASESQYEAAIAQVTASRKQVESSVNQLNYTQLKAPFSGIITQVYVEENENVGSGTPIIGISTEGKPEVQVGMPELFITRVRQGQEVDIKFSSFPEEKHKGTVTEVGFSSDGSTTYPVTLLINDPSDKIRPGMAADVVFYFAQEGDTTSQYLIAPVDAIGEDDKGQFVFLLEKKGENYITKKQNIEIGKLMPNGFEVIKGLNDGDLVVTAGLKAILDGMEVKLLKKD